MKLSVNSKAQSLIRKLPVVAAFFICVYYVGTVMQGFSQDTTVVFNLGIGITAALSGLCFAMASNIEKNKAQKLRISYSGERFLHASIAFLIGSILKYAALELHTEDWATPIHWITNILALLFHTFAVPLFIWGVYDSHGGITITNNILWERLYDEKDWDNIA